MSLQGSPGPSRPVVDQVEGHVPVMVEEIVETLAATPGSHQVDATVGGGGHARRILEANSPDGRLLGLDADQAAIARSATRLADFGDRVVLRQANFEQLADVAAETGFEQVDGVLFDLGLSSHQLAENERGFSFRASGALDMRFDATRGTPAHEVLATLSERDLAHVFRQYGEEPRARRIAAEIVARRGERPIRSAVDLAALIEDVATAPLRGRRRVHPATRVFQALRIYVNRELETLPIALAAAVDVLRPGGRLAVLSYHSLEDRIVKRFIAAERRGCVCPPEAPVCVCGKQPRLAPIGKQPRRPSEAEVTRNARARSALLRAARRLAA